MQEGRSTQLDKMETLVESSLQRRGVGYGGVEIGGKEGMGRKMEESSTTWRSVDFRRQKYAGTGVGARENSRPMFGM